MIAMDPLTVSCRQQPFAYLQSARSDNGRMPPWTRLTAVPFS